MHHCAFMHPGIPLFYDDTDTYTTRQKNDHHVNHNATTVTIPCMFLTSTSLYNSHLTTINTIIYSKIFATEKYIRKLWK